MFGPAALFPDGEVRVDSETVTEYFRPVTPWTSSMEALSGITVLLFLAQKTGNLQARLGIQTCNSPDFPGTPSAIGSSSGQITVVGPVSGTTYRFDPNAAGNGDIDNGVTMFRLGVLYSLSGAGAGQATVRWLGMAWR